MKIIFYGHSCFGLEDGNTSIIIDPWLRGNPLATQSPEGLRPNLILVTH